MIDSRVILWRLCRIIQTQMNLTNEQVWIYDQKRNIPPKTNLWVVVRFLTGKPYGNVNRFVDGAEQQTLFMSGIFTIDIFSRDDSALARKEEIPMSFKSNFAQQMQERYAFKVGRIPTSFVDLSVVEGAAIPYRYSINLQVQYKLELVRSVDYFDHFSETITPEA